MLGALLPSLMPLVGNVLDRIIPDEHAKQKALQDIEKNLVDNATKLNLEIMKTNQIEAAHKNVWVSGWRPAIGWSCSLGIFWAFIGFPVAQWVVALQGMSADLPNIQTDMLFELTLAMLGMAGLRTFEKLKGITK